MFASMPHPPHNKPNGVLALFRVQRRASVPIALHAEGFLNGITRLASEGYTVAQIEYARRVLTRLVRLARSNG